VTVSKEAVNQIKTRSSKIQSWFLDMTLIMSYWGEGEKRAYHHTAPVNSLYALHESLVILKEEALENAWQRHDANHDLLKNALNKIGLTLAVPEDIRLPQLNAVNIPNGVDDESIRKTLLGEHNIEIGAGLGTLAGKIWRIGLMGYSSNPQNIARCATALDAVLNQN
jgi:alanine-glyoxylate transaminase/serine-glyoxylate transaminase/serine-pyruvate transaminase